MRLLVLFALFISVHSYMGEEMMQMKKWAFMKAQESCLGESIVKQWMIKTKKAASECSGRDAPELELPMFNHPYELVNMLTDDDDDDVMNSNGGNDAGVTRLMEKYIQMQMLKQFSSVNNNQARRRFRRDSHDDDGEDPLSLGNRLHKQLAIKKKEMEAKIGNMTCIAKECGMLGANGEFDVADIKKKMSELKFPNEWLKKKMNEACDGCIQITNSFPQKWYEECGYGKELGKVKVFKKCMTKCTMKICMKNDIRQKLEKNFGKIEDLTVQTGLKENDLYQVVKQMLSGPENMF